MFIFVLLHTHYLKSSLIYNSVWMFINSLCQIVCNSLKIKFDAV